MAGTLNTPCRFSLNTSAQTCTEAVRTDIAGLLNQVASDATSRLFILTTPLVVKMWSIMGATSTTAFPAFPTLGVQGGDITGGLRVVATDAVATGQVVLVDAAAIAASSDTIE